MKASKQLLIMHTIGLCLTLCLIFISCTTLSAQIWTAIPPYNVLWPLWSPALSPPNDVGVPTPLITSLTSKTVLPVEPALVWDPDLPFFWLLYNNPYGVGVKYYNPYKKYFYSWPPSYLTTANPLTGAAIPVSLTLPTDYANLISFDPALWLNFWVPLANTLYQDTYYAAVNPYLLTAVNILPAGYTYFASYTIPAL